MEAIIDKLVSNLAIMAAAMSLSMAATLGVAIACRLLKWAPLNITVNVSKFDSEDS